MTPVKIAGRDSVFGAQLPFGPVLKKSHRGLPGILVSKIACQAICCVNKGARGAANGSGLRSPGRCERLCIALLSNDEDEINDLLDLPVQGLRQYIRLLCELEAAARVLGDWWMSDRASFVAVTAGTGRILEILRRNCDVPTNCTWSLGPPILFASVPGEQHTLGVRMAAELFRVEGWDVVLKIGLSEEELISEIEARPGCVVGLSIGGTHSVDALARFVEATDKAVQRSSIMVCGQNIDDLRSRLSSIAVDEIASEIDDARLKVASLWRADARVG